MRHGNYLTTVILPPQSANPFDQIGQSISSRNKRPANRILKGQACRIIVSLRSPDCSAPIESHTITTPCGTILPIVSPSHSSYPNIGTVSNLSICVARLFWAAIPLVGHSASWVVQVYKLLSRKAWWEIFRLRSQSPLPSTSNLILDLHVQTLRRRLHSRKSRHSHGAQTAPRHTSRNSLPRCSSRKKKKRRKKK